MTEQGQVKKQLEDQLEKGKQRLQIIDMIEEKLFQMKELAQGNRRRFIGQRSEAVI